MYKDNMCVKNYWATLLYVRFAQIQCAKICSWYGEDKKLGVCKCRLITNAPLHIYYLHVDSLQRREIYPKFLSLLVFYANIGRYDRKICTHWKKLQIRKTIKSLLKHIFFSFCHFQTWLVMSLNKVARNVLFVFAFVAVVILSSPAM
mgnify:FL=1